MVIDQDHKMKDEYYGFFWTCDVCGKSQIPDKYCCHCGREISKIEEEPSEEEQRREFRREVDELKRAIDEIKKQSGLDKTYPYTGVDLTPTSWTLHSPCEHCSNNPKNGGTGICHCILGSPQITC